MPDRPSEANDLPVKLRLTVPDSVHLSGTALLRMDLLNAGDRPVEFLFGGRRPGWYNFRVRRADGSLVWSLRPPNEWVETVGFPGYLSPGQAYSYTAEWDLRDHAGCTVAPGTYYVTGAVGTDLRLGWTQPHPLVVRP